MLVGIGTVKDIYKKPTANIELIGERLNAYF